MNPKRIAFLQEFQNFKVSLPEGKDFLHEIQRVETSKTDVRIANAVAQVMRNDRYILAGTHTLLLRHEFNEEMGHDIICVMSDHACEVADHEPIVSYARANAPLKHVLFNGLGIGVAIDLLAPYVEHFTIVELSRSVIKLVQPYYDAKYPGRIDVINHDALLFRPPKGERYNLVWHDIWDHIDYRNLKDMKWLHRQYGRFCDKQYSWARNYCEANLRRRKQHPERYEDEIKTSDVIKSLNTIFAMSEEEIA